MVSRHSVPQFPDIGKTGMITTKRLWGGLHEVMTAKPVAAVTGLASQDGHVCHWSHEGRTLPEDRIACPRVGRGEMPTVFKNIFNFICIYKGSTWIHLYYKKFPW